jgi:hypothetical protein
VETSKIGDVVCARRGWLPALLIVFGAGAISFMLTGRQIWLADWGIIDDHEIFYFLGNKQHLPFSQIVSTVLDKTEVGSLMDRFRPSYYFLRVLESWAWGRNVHLWYGVCTMAFAIFLGSVCWVISRFLGLLPSTLCMAPIALARFWGTIWGRLGPSEIYAVPAIGLMLLGGYELLFAPSKLRRNLGCAVLTVGTLVSVGVKETLLPLAFLTLFLVGLAVADRRLTMLTGLISGAITLLYSSIIAWVVMRHLTNAGIDIYGNTVSPAARIKTTLTSMRPFSDGFIVVAMLTIGVVAGWIVRSRKPLRSVESMGILGMLCFLLGLFVTQQLSYDGSLPTATRYDFPAMLIPVGFVIFTGCVFNSRTRETGNEALADRLALGFGIAIVIGFLSTGGIGGLRSSIDQVETNIVKTREFSAELAAIVSGAKAHPAAPVVFEAYGVGAYEAVYSLQRYLLSAELQNPIAVRLHPDQGANGLLYASLEKELRALQDVGGDSFAKLASLPATGPCLSIGINGEADAKCERFRIQT